MPVRRRIKEGVASGLSFRGGGSISGLRPPSPGRDNEDRLIEEIHIIPPQAEQFGLTEAQARIIRNAEGAFQVIRSDGEDRIYLLSRRGIHDPIIPFGFPVPGEGVSADVFPIGCLGHDSANIGQFTVDGYMRLWHDWD